MVLPTGFVMIRRDHQLILCIVEPDKKNVPIVACSATIYEDMSVTASIAGFPLRIPPNEPFCRKIRSLTDAMNLMALIKRLMENNRMDHASASTWLETSILSLKMCLSKQDLGAELRRKLSFYLEQIELGHDTKLGARRYSTALRVFAYRLYKYNMQAYKHLLDQGMIILPCPRSLHYLTEKAEKYAKAKRLGLPTEPNRIDRYSGLTSDYVTSGKVNELSVIERNVCLSLDEVQSATTSTDGEFGTADSNDEATALCFTIQSLAGDYHDVVGIEPMEQLNVDKLSAAFYKALTFLHKTGFRVVVVVGDSFPSSRLLFTNKLGKGDLRPVISNPVTKEPLFLMFDMTDNLQNVYSVWQERKHFKLPAFGNGAQGETEADFRFLLFKMFRVKPRHVQELYELEQRSGEKLAYQLTEAALDPVPGEGNSAKWALQVFDERTAQALRHYSEELGKPWTETAAFIELILQFWHIVNDSNPITESIRRSYSALDDRVSYLLTFAEFLNDWRTGFPDQGLTDDTSIALEQSCRALAAATEHCLDVENGLGFERVLLKKFSSSEPPDPAVEMEA